MVMVYKKIRHLKDGTPLWPSIPADWILMTKSTRHVRKHKRTSRKTGKSWSAGKRITDYPQGIRDAMWAEAMIAQTEGADPLGVKILVSKGMAKRDAVKFMAHLKKKYPRQ